MFKATIVSLANTRNATLRAGADVARERLAVQHVQRARPLTINVHERPMPTPQAKRPGGAESWRG